MKQEKYKVKKLVVKDFKSIENLDYDFNGKSAFIIGDNSFGKTSLIQSIWACLSKKSLPQQPIRKGAEKAEIITIIGNDKMEYKVKLSITEKGEYLEITSPDGFTTTKLANLEKLVGDIDFDIFEFIDLGKTVPGRRKQVEIIKSFLSQETINELVKHDETLSKITETRQYINKRIADLKGLVNTDGFSDEQVETYKELIPVTDLLRAYDEAKTHNDSLAKHTEVLEKMVNDKNSVIENSRKLVESKKQQIKDLEETIKRAEETMMKVEQDIKDIGSEIAEKVIIIDKSISEQNEVITTFVPIPLDEMKDKIDKANYHNEMVTKISGAMVNRNELATNTEKYSELGKQMKSTETEKAKIISGSTLPIEGLTFDDNGLYLNGLPLTEEQLATNELIRVGCKLAIAKNPNVGIVKISRSESLGKVALAEMLKLAKDNDFQFFFEEVGRDATELRIQIVEDTNEQE